MRYETAQAEAIPDMKNEILASREPFFTGDVSLDTHYVFCGDKRGVIGIEDYVHMFGGVLNSSYNLLILHETAQPGSVTKPFDEYAEELVPVMKRLGVNPGIHSDHKTEQGESLLLSKTDGPVGCVYAKERAAISRLIADSPDVIIHEAAALRPELFQDTLAHSVAHAIAAAHGRLADREGVVSNGRSAVLRAAAGGAKGVVVDGETEAKAVGIINLGEGSMRSQPAMAAGLPAYVQDAWAAAEIFDRAHDLYPQNKEQALIAETIDTIGTLRALGIPPEDIAVRR